MKIIKAYSKEYLLSLLLFLIVPISFGQLILGNDTTICGNQPLTINANGTSNNTLLTGITLNSPTCLSENGNSPLSDDSYSQMVNIGFLFNFFGQNYGQLTIGSNGILSFDNSNANAYCTWNLSGITFPNSMATAKASFMGCYQDINPAVTSNALQPEICYQTIGTAPNRKFVVLYKNVYFFSCTTVCNYMAFILYEGSNILEAHIGNKPTCPSWGSGLAAQGVQNQAGTVAFMTPGRNVTVWTANQDSRRWTPASSTNTNSYTISQIPYTYVSTSTNNNLAWFTLPSGTQYAPYNNGVLTVNTSTLPVGTTGFFVQGSACGSGLGAITDTSWVTKTQTSVTATSISDTCSNGVGSAMAVATPAGGVYTYNWSPGNITTPSANNLVNGTYTVSITDTSGCTASTTVTVNNVTPSFTSTFTPVSCVGGSDGTATISPVVPMSGITYDWYEVGQSGPMATGLTAGLHRCKVTSPGGCIDTVSVTLTTLTALNVSLISSTNVDCYNMKTGKASVNVTGGTAPYSYVWSNSTSTNSSVTDLPNGDSYVVVKDAKQCVDTLHVTLTQPNPLSVLAIIPDSMICSEDSIQLYATGGGGSSPYIYDWFTINNSSTIPVVSNQQNVTVNPDFSGQKYILKLSEQCGSQPAFDTVTITFPTNIVPTLLVDQNDACMPGTFVFTNDSSTQNTRIATYNVNFGIGSDTLLGNNFSVTKIYPNSGYYDVTINAISDYGCHYSNTLPSFIWVAPKPTAGYGTDKNPTTIFETDIQFNDNSSNDVTQWFWSVPGSAEKQSTERNPRFKFPEGVEGDYPVELVVTTQLGCSDTITGLIHVVSDVTFYAPNTFTPNGDEHNNTFVYYINGIDRNDFSMTIYNRWGEVVWENHDPDFFWDGTYHGRICPAGTYIYIVQAKDGLTGKVVNYKGHINILK